MENNRFIAIHVDDKQADGGCELSHNCLQTELRKLYDREILNLAAKESRITKVLPMSKMTSNKRILAFLFRSHIAFAYDNNFRQQQFFSREFVPVSNDAIRKIPTNVHACL